MFKKRTLFVVGAGASAEYGLPVGTALAATIGKKLDVQYDRFGQEPKTGDIELWQQIQYANQQEILEYQKAAWLIRDGVLLSNSIDDFLDVHADNERAVKIAKAAIARSILEAERKSKLFYDRSNIYNKFNFSKVDGTWLIKLMRMLGRGVPPQKAHSIFDNVSFVVFNYDRCISPCGVFRRSQKFGHQRYLLSCAEITSFPCAIFVGVFARLYKVNRVR